MFPAGVVAYSLKIVAVWTASGALVIADVTVFDPQTLFGSLGAIVILLIGAALTVRSNAIKFWKGEADAATAHGRRMERERDEALSECRDQRDAKHEALTELAALKMRTDLTPVLEVLTGVQKDLVARQLDRDEITATLTGLKDALERQTALLGRIADRLEERTR